MDITMEAPSAAAKVFDIPELLEKILQTIGNDDIWKGQLQQYTPSLTLFRLQRTSKTFRATIHGSRHLRRLMFLSHASPASPEGAYVLSDEAAAADSANLRPFWWLLELTSSEPERFLPLAGTVFGVVTMPSKKVSVAPKADGLLELPDRMAGEGASWRRMTTFRSEPLLRGAPLIRQTVHVLREGDSSERRYTATVFPADHETLGELWDCYHGIMARSLKQEDRDLEDGKGCYSCFGMRDLEDRGDSKADEFHFGMSRGED